MKQIKIVSIIISIMLMVLALPLGITATAATPSWDGTTITQPTSMKTIDGVYYYEISTAEELAYIAKTGGDWLGYNYILANDITLNSVELTYDANGNLTVNASALNQWTPINGFTGIFDGNGFTVSGVYVNTTSSAGFFTNNQGILKNLTIKNSYIKGSSSVGGICGSFTKTGAEFSNCEFHGAVVGNYNVGGLIGTNDCSNIENCINYGNVFGESNVGGIVGKFEAYGIDNSKNYGKITATGNSVGGIAGNAYYPISGCVNYGDVSGNDYVGGIFGNIFWGSNVTSCGNVGKITGNNYVGGLIGDNTGLWNDTTISNSYNTGEVIGNSKVGGLAGNISYGGVYNSYNVGNVSGTELVGAVIGYSGTVWGQGTVSNCVYMKTETINATLKGFGNADDVDGVVNAKDDSFFCINSDKTLNKNGHTYSSTEPCDVTCTICGYIKEVFSGWLLDEGKWNYYENGLKATGWKYVGSTWYWFDDDGIMQSNWQYINNTWYYFNIGGAMQTGWQYVGNAWYYMNEGGAMQTGWLQLGNTWYYLGDGGAMQTGWQYIGNTWYYMNEGGAMTTGWQYIGNTWYYMNEGGAMTTGWQYIGNVWYHMNESGAMQTGWINLGGTWYYMNAGGAMQTGWKRIGGVWYYFYDSGAMAANCWIGNYWINAGGVWVA